MRPLEVLSILAIIWIIVYLVSQLLKYKKHGIEVTPLFLMYRTKRLNAFLNNIAQRNRKVWRIFATMGILVGIIEMFYATYFLFDNLFRFIYVPEQAAPIVPILPGITISLRWFPYLLIAISLTITIHELSHGIVSFLERIPVKSAGIVIAPVTFGGFVEFDEDEFESASLTSKLKVISAGSLSNTVGGVLIFLLIIALFAPASGVLVTDVPKNGPAYSAGMRSWDVIYSIDEWSVDNLTSMALYMAHIGPQTSLLITTSNGIRHIVTEVSSENASRGVIGVQGLTNYHPMRWGEIYSQLSYHLYMVLWWTSLLMINLAIFNMLPLFPLDGEKIIYYLLKERVKLRIKEIRVVINAVFLSLFALNVGLSLLIKGTIAI